MKVKGQLNQSEKFFQNHGFKITVEANLIQTDYLDITLNLSNNTYAPFRKENSHIRYVNNQSNHPKLIKKSIGPMVSKRLNKLSSSEEIFNNIKKDYKSSRYSPNETKVSIEDKSDKIYNPIRSQISAPI